MKQVVTINLGGNAYQLDEDGYEALAVYLDDARARLAGNPDIEEIMSDLELAIADKAGRFLGPGKSVVSGAEVDRIIEEMGPVDMPPGDESAEGVSDAGPAGTADTGGAAAAGAGAAGPRREARGEPRKLYRLTDSKEKMIAGVCSGLAAYLGIDVSILRIIFLVLAFASAGIALIAYLLAALIIPAAETPEQRAAAYGVPFDAQDVIARAKSKVSEFHDDRQARRQRRAEQHYRAGYARGSGQDLFRWLLAAIVIVVGVVLVLSLLAGFFPMMGRPVMIPAIPGNYWQPAWPGIIPLVLILCLVLWLLGRPSRDGNGSFPGSVLLGTVQLVAIIGLIWFAYHSISFVRYVVDGTVMTVHRMF